MYFSNKVRIETPKGPAFVDPDHVVAVLKGTNSCAVLLSLGNHIAASEGSEAIAKRLWRFTNETDDAYFNERHVVAIVSNEEGGCTVLLTGGSTLNQPISAEEAYDLHRLTNATRNASTTEA